MPRQASIAFTPRAMFDRPSILLGSTDGNECVTHENIGRKPAHAQVVFVGTPQTDG